MFKDTATTLSQNSNSLSISDWPLEFEQIPAEACAVLCEQCKEILQKLADHYFLTELNYLQIINHLQQVQVAASDDLALYTKNCQKALQLLDSYDLWSIDKKILQISIICRLKQEFPCDYEVFKSSLLSDLATHFITANLIATGDFLPNIIVQIPLSNTIKNFKDLNKISRFFSDIFLSKKQNINYNQRQLQLIHSMIVTKSYNLSPGIWNEFNHIMEYTCNQVCPRVMDKIYMTISHTASINDFMNFFAGIKFLFDCGLLIQQNFEAIFTVILDSNKLCKFLKLLDNFSNDIKEYIGLFNNKIFQQFLPVIIIFLKTKKTTARKYYALAILQEISQILTNKRHDYIAIEKIAKFLNIPLPENSAAEIAAPNHRFLYRG